MTDFLPKMPNLANMIGADFNRMDKRIADSADLMRKIEKQKSARDEELAGRHDAKDIFEYLTSRVSDFQRDLNEDEEIGLQLANFGLAAQLHIRSIGYKNPNLIEFQGVDANGNESALVQHISQLNFMLIAVKPFKETPYRIGFV